VKVSAEAQVERARLFHALHQGGPAPGPAQCLGRHQVRRVGRALATELQGAGTYRYLDNGLPYDAANAL